MLNKYDAFVFDLDGTLYKEDRLIPGADKTVNLLKSAGKKVVFISNKTTGTSYDYYLLLKHLNINAESEEVINSTIVIKNYLIQNHPGSTFYAIGEKVFIKELESSGFTYSENPEAIEIVIVTLDRTLNFNKIEIAARALEKGAKFYAANIDNTCPVMDGEITDAGVTISALEKRIQRKLELHFGKPSEFMFNEIKQKLNTPNDKILLIGDRLETDIAMGNFYQIDTALVTTGVKNFNNEIMPTYYINSVSDLLNMNL